MSKSTCVAAGMTVGQAYTAILGDGLAQLLQHAAGVRKGVDPESVHQMRVGLRRLRLALRLFDQWITAPPDLLAELGWLGVRLGAARDADVLADTTLAAMARTCPPDEAIVALQEAARRHAQALHKLAATAVKSPRCVRLVRDLTAWHQGAPWQATADDAQLKDLHQPIGAAAARMLRRRHARLVEIGKALNPDLPAERHRLRIAAKKLRYATEFFQSLPTAKHTRRRLHRLGKLLDLLGSLNDAAVADRLLHDLALREPALTGSASFARGYLCATTAQRLPELAPCWRRLLVAGRL
jgi:triphosphatase